MEISIAVALISSHSHYISPINQSDSTFCAFYDNDDDPNLPIMESAYNSYKLEAAQLPKKLHYFIRLRKYLASFNLLSPF